MKKDTSWNRVAGWYGRLLEGEGTYQKELILPNLMRLMEIRRCEKILDLACGQGFFAHEFAKAGAEVVGADAARKLIDIAKKTASGATSFRVARADALPFIKNGTMNKVAIILALQNIENAAAVLHETARVLKTDGLLYLVLNHPAFRIPKSSSWGWDEAGKTQYRRVDRYLSELKVPIQMQPGKNSSKKLGESTLSFHRPLQFYFKALHKAGFSAIGLEEWNSHKKSESGPRAKAEDAARREIPLFMCIIARKD